MAILEGPNPNVARGTITFTEAVVEGRNALLVRGSVTGLTPGRHGFHIHEFGDLTDGCDTAGSHYNPLGKPHGGLEGTERHKGDMGNIFADSQGVAEIDLQVNGISLRGQMSVAGRSVVVHADEDDLGLGSESDSLTTGHSGDRLSCGVIGLKELG